MISIEPSPVITANALRCDLALLTGPSRRVDVLIAVLIDLCSPDEDISFRRSFEISGIERMTRLGDSHQSIWNSYLPRYTGSIDGAKMMIPPGYRIAHLKEDIPAIDGPPQAACRFWLPNNTTAGWTPTGLGPTTPIAICNAALRVYEREGL